jgi:hypothetical protein
MNGIALPIVTALLSTVGGMGAFPCVKYQYNATGFETFIYSSGRRLAAKYPLRVPDPKTNTMMTCPF